MHYARTKISFPRAEKIQRIVAARLRVQSAKHRRNGLLRSSIHRRETSISKTGKTRRQTADVPPLFPCAQRFLDAEKLVKKQLKSESGRGGRGGSNTPRGKGILIGGAASRRAPLLAQMPRKRSASSRSSIRPVPATLWKI